MPGNLPSTGSLLMGPLLMGPLLMGPLLMGPLIGVRLRTLYNRHWRP